MSRPAVGGKSSMISMGHFCLDTGSVCPCPRKGPLDFSLQQEEGEMANDSKRVVPCGDFN